MRAASQVSTAPAIQTPTGAMSRAAVADVDMADEDIEVRREQLAAANATLLG
jgi:hypothetical protein